MASKRRMHLTATPTRSRKRAKLSNITNFSGLSNHSENIKGSSSLKSSDCSDQLVPGSEACWEEFESSSIYCSEDLKHFSSSDTRLTKKKNRVSCKPGGYFACLPPEILHKVLSSLTPVDMKSLALSSRQLVSYVQGYVYTAAGLAHILPSSPSSFSDVTSKDTFISLGKLLKALSFLQPIKTRLKTVSYFIAKLEPIHSAISEYNGTSVGYECFGAMFNSFVNGWNHYEKTKAYSLLQSVAKLDEKVGKVLQSAPGTLRWHEKDVRILHRLLFLSPAKDCDEEYRFWLSLILKPWPIVFQAKLLYLLTAPGDASGHVFWTEACGCSHLQHTTSGQVDFSELARALKLMYSGQTSYWTEDDVISIFNEVTTATPNGWCLENVAQLLLACGTDITRGVLGSKAINGREEELGMLCYYLANACTLVDLADGTSDKDIRWFLDILSYTIRHLPATIDKSQFIANLVGKWKSYISALFNDYDLIHGSDSDIDDIETEFHSTLSSLTHLCFNLLLMNMKS